MFINPIKNGYITSSFGPRKVDRNDGKGLVSSKHQGVDLSRQPNTNVEILAAAAGKVIRVGTLGTYGNVVMIRHVINGVTYETNYAHLKSYNVKVGQTVKQGQVIGIMGATGGNWAPHLHFEIHKGIWKSGQPNAVDPEKYVKFYSKKELQLMEQQIKALNDKVIALEKLVNSLDKPVEAPKQVVSDWAKHSADWAKKNGITDGTRPKDLITREEVWVSLERAHKVK